MRGGPSPSSTVSGWSLNPEAFGRTWSHTSALLLTLLSLKVKADIGSATEPEGPHAAEKSQLNEKKHGRPWPRFFWGLTGAKHSWGRRFKWAAERAASNGGRWSTAGSSPCAQKTMCQQDNSCSLSPLLMSEVDVFGCCVSGRGQRITNVGLLSNGRQTKAEYLVASPPIWSQITSIK